MLRALLLTMAMAAGFTMTRLKAETRPRIDSITIHSRTGVSMEFVYIPPGTYTIGRDVGTVEVVLRSIGQSGSGLDEGPVSRVTFERGYYLSRHQVTAAQFALFLNDSNRDIAVQSVVLNSRSNLQQDATGRYRARDGADRFPANTVTWKGAVEFTKWLKEKSGWSVRLPSEEEWEAAARTQQGFLIPTGGPEQAVDPETGLLPGIRAGKPNVDVGAFPENMTITGLFHTLNAVGDWTSDVYRTDRATKERAAINDALIVKREGGHVLKRCLSRLTERQLGTEVGESGIFGVRVLLEANEMGSPLRVITSTPMTR